MPLGIGIWYNPHTNKPFVINATHEQWLLSAQNAADLGLSQSARELLKTKSLKKADDIDEIRMIAIVDGMVRIRESGYQISVQFKARRRLRDLLFGIYEVLKDKCNSYSQVTLHNMATGEVAQLSLPDMKTRLEDDEPILFKEEITWTKYPMVVETIKQLDDLKLLIESSLSRILNYSIDYECAIISASRGNPKDTSMCAMGNTSGYDAVYGTPEAREQYNAEFRSSTKRPTVKYDINYYNTRNLKAALVYLGYVVIPVRSIYIENFRTPIQRAVKENSFFVVNRDSDEEFEDRLVDLGKKYCQDSVLFIPKGGVDAYLYGTNLSDFPGLGQRIRVGRLFLGHPQEKKEFHTLVQGRPFAYDEVVGEMKYENLERSSAMACKRIAKMILEHPILNIAKTIRETK